LHEYEALLFSDPKVTAGVLLRPDLADRVASVRADFPSPEEINDHPQTSPSRRLVNIFDAYDKVFHGTIAARRIGLARMRAECKHFDAWVGQLEALAGR